MSDPLDMVFISAHPNGVAQCLRSRSPVPGQTASSRRPAVRRGTRPRAQPGRRHDWDGDAEMASYIADLDAGRARIPEEWEVEGPAATIGLGDAADVDLAELAAMLGPDGLGGEVFAQDRSADAMRPGPGARRADRAGRRGPGPADRQPGLGAMSAARRLAARAAWLELTAVAEFTRRRDAQLADATAREVPRGCRDGEFPDAELGMELVTSPAPPATRWTWPSTCSPAAPHLGRAGRRADRRVPGPAHLEAHPAPDRRRRRPRR